LSHEFGKTKLIMWLNWTNLSRIKTFG